MFRLSQEPRRGVCLRELGGGAPPSTTAGSPEYTVALAPGTLCSNRLQPRTMVHGPCWARPMLTAERLACEGAFGRRSHYALVSSVT